MRVPDYISPIVGYRVWTWDTKGLKSLCGERWHPSQSLAARCRASAVVGPIVGRVEAVHDAHEPPQTNCTCGVYAAKNLEHLRYLGYEGRGIRGEVYLWGTVVEHELRVACAVRIPQEPRLTARRDSVRHEGNGIPPEDPRSV